MLSLDSLGLPGNDWSLGSRLRLCVSGMSDGRRVTAGLMAVPSVSCISIVRCGSDGSSA